MAKKREKKQTAKDIMLAHSKAKVDFYQAYLTRYLATGKWDPHATVATLSNAMDVSKPNNWPRVEELFKVKGWDLKELGYGKLSDPETEAAMREVYANTGYVCEPHGAIAWKVLQNTLEEGDTGIFLCTAAPPH